MTIAGIILAHGVITVFMLIECKQIKLIISNQICAQLDSKQFQEVNFLTLIKCCIVIEQIAEPLCSGCGHR